MTKLFNVNGTDITISRGDTGALRIGANVKRKDTGADYTFGERDRALFSIKNSRGELKRQKAYPMVNNAFIVVFTNQDTENLDSGAYTWDVRYIINPYYEGMAPGLEPGESWVEYSQLTFPIYAGQKCIHNYICYYANQNILTAEAWTEAHWTEFWPDYGDLSFPVAAGTRCKHSGTYYIANQQIASSEEWTSAHWNHADYRTPVDGDQVITPNLPMSMNMLTVVGEI